MSKQPGYGTPMDRRWRYLLVIGLTVLVTDQATKFLAVKHLTPGIADAILQTERVVSRRQQSELLQDTGLGQQVALHLGAVRNPCRTNGRMCPEVKVFDGFWSWRYTENKGAAWSMFAQLPDGLRLPLLIGVSLLAMLLIGNFVRRLEPEQTTLLVALSLVMGGALGNLVDRAYLGYVIDFILWYYDGFYWPTFNVADVAISSGVGLIVVASLQDFVRNRGRDPAQSGVAQH